MNNRKFIYSLLIGLLLLAGVSSVLAEAYPCEEPGEIHIWLSPKAPKAGESFKAMAVATDGLISGLELVDRQGRKVTPSEIDRREGEGPPSSFTANWNLPDEGDFRIVAQRNGENIACRRLERDGMVEDRAGEWGLATEAFYAAWIEALFGAPIEETLSFSSLSPVLGNKGRNFLYNYLGKNEDEKLSLTPDCADLPYTLRAYFAWKVGLPLAYRVCSRGSAKAPPTCGTAVVRTEFTHGALSQAGFRQVGRALADAVHSGSARTGLESDATDLYPLPLNRKTLWPGTVFADPYGHVMVLVEWVPQTADRPGILLAADAQPDNTVARKRFWEGTFLFTESESAGPGFKAFRPLVRSAKSGWRSLTNDELVDHPGFRAFSLEQEQLAADDFYARMGRLINPDGLDPKQAFDALLDALVEQLETRIASVDNGEDYFKQHHDSVIPMPSGAGIFQTVGPWEDYSTPSRDLRLLIAINVLTGLPERIVRHPEMFVLNDKTPEQAKAEIEAYSAQRITERRIRYTRSDGSPWELSVADILERKAALEMAYNPNDCVEVRWGAEEGSEEYATCGRHAPASQRAKMAQYRLWFRDARRPVM